MFPLLFAAGIGLTYASLSKSIPGGEDLLEIEGHLLIHVYEVVGRHRGRGGHEVSILALHGNARRFWMPPLPRRESLELLLADSVSIRFYVDAKSADLSVAGKDVRAYGLWANGKEIESLDAAIRHDRLLYRYFFPSLGIILCGFMVVAIRQGIAYLRRSSSDM